MNADETIISHTFSLFFIRFSYPTWNECPQSRGGSAAMVNGLMNQQPEFGSLAGLGQALENSSALSRLAVYFLLLASLGAATFPTISNTASLGNRGWRG